MNHRKISGIISCLVGLILGTTARSQDEITYYDRAKKTEDRVTGSIQSETPGKIVIKPVTGAAKEIAVLDIQDVVYNVPALLKPDYRSAINAEGRAEKAAKEADRKKEVNAALAKYQDLLGRATEKTVKRHFEFKIAKMTAEQAEDDAKVADGAVDRLNKFKKDHPDSWQISGCTQFLAKLLMEKKDFSAAQKVYEELEQTATVTDDMRRDCEYKIAQILLKAGKADAAKERLQNLIKTAAADSPEGMRIEMAFAETRAASGDMEEVKAAVAALKGIIAKVTDPDIRALAHNTLGDCYRRVNWPREALYEYLWVDVIFHQNRAEHAKALYYAAKLFQELKDEKNANEYRGKLESSQFAGLEYQKLLASEKK